MSGAVPMKAPWFVALDVDSGTRARELAQELAPYVGGFKLGPRLLLREGGALIEELSRLAPVFVDQKYHDIPSTMTAAVRATFEMGASFCTIHASSGRDALKAVALTEAELNQKRPFKVLAVTVLTSLAENRRPQHWRGGSFSELVGSMASEVHEAGLSGLVCSGHEVTQLRSQFPHFFLLTPGIRLSGDSAGDQSRTMLPAEALAAGSSALVVGRSVIEASNPTDAAAQVMQQVRSGKS